MNEIKAPLKLDSLDDNTAVFRGNDAATFGFDHPFLGGIEHEVGWPALMIPRAVYEELGCPSMLMVEITQVSVTE